MFTQPLYQDLLPLGWLCLSGNKYSERFKAIRIYPLKSHLIPNCLFSLLDSSVLETTCAGLLLENLNFSTIKRVN